MNTKANPGEFDCYGKIGEHEPYFLLRAADMFAPNLVRIWAQLALALGCPSEKCSEAVETARRMEDWAAQNGNKCPD